MRCSEVQHKMEWLDAQELASSVCERIEAHLKSCAECREALAKLRRFEDLLTASPAPSVPEGFAARVVSRAKQQQTIVTRSEPARRRSLWSAWRRFEISAGAAAALAAGLLLGIFLGHETWRGVAQHVQTPEIQSADLLSASGFNLLAEPRGDSLADAYLQLTLVVDR